MTGLDPRTDQVVRDAVDAFIEGRLRPGYAGNAVFETKNSRYRLVDGALVSAPDASIVGAELVGWLIETSRRCEVELAWQAFSRAVLLDRQRGRHIIVTSSTRLFHVEKGLSAAASREEQRPSAVPPPRAPQSSAPPPPSSGHARIPPCPPAPVPPTARAVAAPAPPSLPRVHAPPRPMPPRTPHPPPLPGTRPLPYPAAPPRRATLAPSPTPAPPIAPPASIAPPLPLTLPTSAAAPTPLALPPPMMLPVSPASSPSVAGPPPLTLPASTAPLHGHAELPLPPARPRLPTPAPQLEQVDAALEPITVDEEAEPTEPTGLPFLLARPSPTPIPQPPPSSQPIPLARLAPRGAPLR